jgi:hypothetical protein
MDENEVARIFDACGAISRALRGFDPEDQKIILRAALRNVDSDPLGVTRPRPPSSTAPSTAPPSPSSPKPLTEVARMLRVPPSALNQRIKSGKLRTYGRSTRAGRPWLLSVPETRAVLEASPHRKRGRK